MSKIGKKEIKLPSGTEVSWTRDSVTVKGQRGELTKRLALTGFTLTVTDGVLKITPPTRLEKNTQAMWGTLNSIISSLVQGVNNSFSKVLEFEGVGYKAEVSGNDLILNMGFSHSVKLRIPDNLTVTAQKNQITVSGLDKEQVGLFAAKIRKVRPIEPYKLRGIKYRGEIIKKKAGKKLAGAGA